MAGKPIQQPTKKPRRGTPEQPPPQDAAAADLVRLLPDVLADALRLLPPRGLAACRCVCKAWRAAVDSRRLLHADLLPLSLGGVFISFAGRELPDFLARPSTSSSSTAAASSDDSWLDGCLPNVVQGTEIEDHCNGLLLLDESDVLNPITRMWARLPLNFGSLCNDEVYYDYYTRYVAYDPTVSPHYEVLAIPCFSDERGNYHADEEDPRMEESEWPPPLCTFHLFSSRTMRWEERSFARDGEAGGTVASMRLRSPVWRRYAVYWREILYVHCETDFVMRYQVIKPPMGLGKYEDIYLGKSRKGVYLASLDAQCWLQVWRLEDSCDQMAAWVLMHYRDLKRMVPRQNPDQQAHGHGPWVLQDVNYRSYCKLFHPDKIKEARKEEGFDWNSDDDDVLDSGDKVGVYGRREISILGFHPFKEVVFLSESSTRALAYHLRDSKVQDLGSLYITECDGSLKASSRQASFPYTPCWSCIPGTHPLV